MPLIEDALLVPLQMRAWRLANRVVMAPMTRNRADPGGMPSALMAQYYGQRATAGMIVVEGTAPSPDGYGYIRIPGVWCDSQARAWEPVVEAIHAGGSVAVLQLMHTGRIACSVNLAEVGGRAVAPSAVQAAGRVWTDTRGMQAFEVPAALSITEIQAVIEDYAEAARRARAAGFDGVELHCTSGYLPMQFVAENSNLRSDGYGGTRTRRVRFVIELLAALAAAIGVDRVGVRICPGNPFNDVVDTQPVESAKLILQACARISLGYVHVIRSPVAGLDAFALARSLFDGPLILNDGLSPASARELVVAGLADAVSFARHFIGNPDVVTRIRSGAELAGFDRNTLYTPGPQGYIDYPQSARLRG